MLLLTGIAFTLYLQRVRLPREETAAGVAALAAMRWRDFIQLVLDALIRRGYERVFESNSGGENGDYVLERDGQRYLLSSKHGAAYVLGSTAIAEFASAIRMRGAAGGLLVTPGKFAAEARPLARAQRIELLDGPTLWPELRPLLPAEQRASISAPSKAGVRRNVMLAWGALAIAGLLIAFGRSERPDSTQPDVTTAVPQATVRTSPPRPPAVAPPGMTASTPSDPAQLEARRASVAGAISSLPGVDRALWQTQSTLLVYLADGQFDPMLEICPELVRYDELAATRLQLQPPAGSTRPVRFVQCRPY
ncbi:restriction endonuclease [Cognatiluteimonas profundi]|uniref:restriction endonuclease n=1 Tax=Cognatiluteimonas profundi TaxID=2594501 RepID=UPI00131C24C6|nr:restriction endonuclease [Lysobacter profundi]